MSDASTKPSTVDAARELAARGWPVIPCRATNKRPLTRNGHKDATTDPEQIENWWKVFPSAMIGVPMGEASGIFAVDVDGAETPEEPDGVAAWLALVEANGLPRTREHATPSGGRHVFVRWRPGISNSTGRLPPGIHVRAEGGYVVFPPSRNATGGSYRVVSDAEVAEPPDWLLDLIGRNRAGRIDWGNKPLPQALLDALKADAGKGVSTKPYDLPQRTDSDPERLRAALAVVPSDDEATWFRVAAALRNELGEAGWPIFHEWSAKSHKYSGEADCRRKWEGCRGYDDITAGTIIHLAKLEDPEWWKQAASPPGVVASPRPKVAEATAARPLVEEPASVAEPKAAPIGVWQHGDAQPEPPRWLVRNRLPEGGLALLAGQWGVGKTFVWLDIAGCVMTGLPWTGEPVYRPGGVLAFTPEGAASIPMRLAALVEHSLAPRIGEPTLFERKPNLARLPFARANACPMLLENGKPNRRGLREMIDTAKALGQRYQEEFGVPLALIVLDTAMAAAGWTSEDSNSEVGMVWNMLREMSEETGALVLIVDHFGKDPERGTRGGSAKEGNTDVIIALLGQRSDSGDVTDTRAVLRKMRDGPQGLELPFAARVVPMGRDEHGYELTQRVIDWNVRREPKQKKAKSHRLFDDVLAGVIADRGKMVRGVRCAERGDVRATYKAAYPSPDVTPDAKRRRFLDALKEAVASGVVRSDTIDGAEYLWFADEGKV